MNTNNINTDKTFTDYLSILFKWKKFILITIVIVGIIVSAATFLIPKQYKATSIIMIPPESSLNLSALTGLAGTGKSSTASLGARLFGMANTSEDILMGILSSQTTLINVINKFDLINYYEIDDQLMDKAIKAFIEDISFEVNDHGMIEVSVINKSPGKSAEISNYFVKILDSINIKLNTEQARNNKSFIEKRYYKNIADLKVAEDSFYLFQKKYGVFAVPQQFEAAVKASAELEGQVLAKEIMLNSLKLQYGESTPIYQTQRQEYELLKNKVDEIKNSDKRNLNSNVFLPFKNAPEISLDYIKYYRELEIQSKILEVMLPLYEQAKLDEQKSMPTIAVVDKARIPDLKYSPKRAFIIIPVVFLILVFLMILVFRANKILNLESLPNEVMVSEKRFYSKIVRLFRIKF